MKRELIQAFLEVRNGYSADRVVLDPSLNQAFIQKCFDLGLTENVRELNVSLLNSRKSGHLSSIPKSLRTTFADTDEYRHASEIAARVLELKHLVSLDVILCDPVLVLEFDQLAAEIAPGFAPLKYRWAALNLRKASRFKPEQISRVLPQEGTFLGRLDRIDFTTIPVLQGIYFFHAKHETLYVGESENLRRRIQKHLDHSDIKELARWLWQNPLSDVQLEIRVLPTDTRTAVRRAIEAELIASRQPRFNIARRR